VQRLIKGITKSGKNKCMNVVPAGVLRFLEFAILDMQQGDTYETATGGRECVLDAFSGAACVTVESAAGEQAFPNVGGREDVFSAPPSVLYLPARSTFRVRASSRFRAGLFFAPAARAFAPTLVAADSVIAKQVGQGSFMRTVYTAISDSFAAEHLLAGETLNAPGCWSSFPPHKHDRSNPPSETPLEEIYYFQIRPTTGFGFIWTYTASEDTDGFNNVFVVENGDTVLLPKGYHPVVAAPGCQLHYTWVLAGEERRYGAWTEDPKYASLKHSF
jgi:5-deoxy-glucuronate isomerase